MHRRDRHTHFTLATQSPPAYLAGLRSPTKRAVARTTPPRSYSPPRLSSPQRKLRHKRAFEGKPTVLQPRDINIGTKSRDAPPSSHRYKAYSSPTSDATPITAIPISPAKHKVETRTKYRVKSPPNYSLPLPQSTSQTRLYPTSSSATTATKRSPATSHLTAHSTPLTSPSANTPPILRQERSYKSRDSDRKRRRMGIYADPPSPPTPSPPRKSSKLEVPLHGASLSQTDPNYVSASRFSASTATTKDRSSQGRYSYSYRYPSISKGTAATPKRRINEGMVPIDTTFSSHRPSAKKPTFLSESPPKHSKYPAKQREGLVVSGDKEQAFRGWLETKARQDGWRPGWEGSTRQRKSSSKLEEKRRTGDSMQGYVMRSEGISTARASGGEPKRKKRKGKALRFWEWVC